ncbi:MAG: zinc-binding dehydrogenase [Candidatus Marinimicrobia bacterium]|nr:zinc-binding dehydrogenase [Candidatus Neomarinimicrobiota bacterium]
MIEVRQMMISAHGGPEVLQEVEASLPEIQAGEVLIRTHFAGVNFSDIMARQGMYPDAPPPPCVVGYEISGVVLATADDVQELQKGDHVMALTRFGGYASHVSVPLPQVRKLPALVSLEEGAAVPVTFLTAHLMLFRQGGLLPGDTVLVHNAGGGVGSALVKLARLKGAHVIATASRSKHERIRDLGARQVIDYYQEDFVAEVMRETGGRGVDLVLDAGGPARFTRSAQVLAPLGKLIMYGVQESIRGRRKVTDIMGLLWNNWRLKFRPLDLMNRNMGVMGFNLGHLWSRQEQVEMALDELLNWLAEGKFKPEIDHIFTYVRAGEAHSYIQSRQNFGKVLLDFRALTPNETHISTEV